ncbi:MAG: Ig domain-containing protein, partial [Bacteroidales bacterium]|nr:Ig domain-containing protein [Bacteroidales bacterium]
MMKLRITSILCLVLSLCSCIKETVHVNGVTLDASALTIAIGDKDKLVATISPSDADNQLVLWSSSDAAVVRVNTDGEISAVAPGQAEITAKSDDGGYTAKCVVTVPEVYVPVKSITLNTEQISLNKGDTASIEANVIPDNATNPALRWMSTDESIATVDTKGTINALAPGKATIIATAEADGRISVSCAVIVEQHVGEIALNKYSLELKELEHETLEVEIKPEDAVDKSVSWKSSDETVAKVTDGTVYAMKAGEAVITATSNDGGKSVDCKVTVTCDVAGVTLSEHELKLIVDESRTLEASVYPSNASNQKLTWTSSKSAVAVVDETGKITAIAPGETLITVRTEDQGKEDNCTVIVDYEVQGVTLSEHNVVVSTGRTLKLSASVKPDNAKNKKLEWTSDAPKVATVSDDGTITGIAPGTAKITVKTAEGGYMDECTVKVEFEVKGVKLDEHSITIATGHTMKLHASVYPADAANKDLAWTSSANDVAEVSQDGIVSAKKPGTAKVTVKTREGDYMDECIVTVDYEVRNVTLSEHNITLSTGHTFTLTASVYPADAANQGLEWSSSAPAVASVSDNGVVTGKAPGEATITVKTKEGAFSDICSVRVEFEVKSVTLSEHNITLDTGKSVKLNATVQPSTAANKSLTWTSDRPDVAAVSPEGVVTAKTPGTARISVSTAEGGFTDDCSVTVDYEVKSVALSEHNITLATGKTVKLGVAVSPSTASNKAVSWSSSDTSVAEVSDDGTVTAKAPGKAVITV